MAVSVRAREVLERPRESWADRDDRRVVLDFQAGDIDAYSEIYRRYQPLARHVSFRMLGTAADAEEAAQETMLRVLQGLPRFNGRFQLQGWVARIATNVSLDVIRARARRPEAPGSLMDLTEADGAGADDDPSELVERRLEASEVHEVLEALPDRHRRALVLRELEGRSHREIGEALGVTPAQAKALIHRAKGSFRRAWETGNGRRGVAALLPFLFPGRWPSFLRRLYQPVQEAATTAATSQASQAVAQAASTPAASSWLSTAERVTAAAVAVLVVGSAGVGVVAINKARKAEPEPRPEAVAAAPAAPSPATPDPAKADEPRKAKVAEEPEVAPVAAVPTPAAAESPSPTASPSPSESPPPGQVVEPVIPPAPAWSIAFASSVRIGAWEPQLLSSSVSGQAGQTLVFSQTVVGPLVGKDGAEHGRLYLEYFGGAEGPTGSVSFWIFVDTPDGRYRYEATGGLAALTLSSDGVTDYLFTGDYWLVEYPVDEDGIPILRKTIPQRGSLELGLRFWADRTSLYQALLALNEAADPAAGS